MNRFWPGVLTLSLLATAVNARGGSLAWPPQDAPKTEATTLAPAALRSRLRTVTSDFAKAGDAASVAQLRKALATLGDPAKDLERLGATWDKAIAGAKAKPNARERAALLEKLRREIAALGALLPALDATRRVELARCILELDADEAQANAVVGRVKDESGAWVTPEALAWGRAATAAAAKRTAASRLEFAVTHAAGTTRVASALGGTWNAVRANGIEIESPFAPAVLERILRQALRAIAFSNALLHGACELPKGLQPHKFVLLDSDAKYPLAVEEAFAHQGMSKEIHDEQVRHKRRSFGDTRGWRTSRFRTEADYEALILWECMNELLGDKAQPCLRTGHLNWVCLEFLGTSMPSATWTEMGKSANARTQSQRDEERQREALWRAARQSTYGCRAWMIRQAQEQRDPSWESTMLDQDGKIESAGLLKATLVCEFLQQEGNLWSLIDGSRQPKAPAATIEGLLGQKLLELEARWRSWLLVERPVGLVQKLERGPASPAVVGEPGKAVITALQSARESAIREPPPEFGEVTLEPELSRAAALHAHYLSLNPEQKVVWPGAHEEYPDKPGFSPLGAMAGARSVIHFDLKPAQAIEGWLGTFYHRLPLLDPGLFGVGFGEKDGVLVLDVASLVVQPWADYVVVWPAPDAGNVPLRFCPELPNPVPGHDQSTFGYPITVQLFFREPKDATRLTMEVSAEDGRVSVPLAGHFLSPQAPLFANLAPKDAWCFIPSAPLKQKTRYKVSATWSSGAKNWSFTTGQ